VHRFFQIGCKSRNDPTEQILLDNERILRHNVLRQQENQRQHADSDNFNEPSASFTTSEISSNPSTHQPTTTNIYNITNNFRAPIANLFLGGLGAGEQATFGRLDDDLDECRTERLLELDDEEDDSEDFAGSEDGNGEEGGNMGGKGEGMVVTG
jgi:hypothetical protein